MSKEVLIQDYPDIFALTKEKYTHVFIVPLVTRGGAELLSLNYINTVANLNSQNKVLVITTRNRGESLWEYKLAKGVKLFDFGVPYKDKPQDEKVSLLFQLISIIKPVVVHNINSNMGFDLFIEYGDELRKVSKLYDSQFCPIITETGENVGFPFTYLPRFIDKIDGVFTDNKKIIEMVAQSFAVDKEKFHVHYQPIDEQLEKDFSNLQNKEHLDVLWASRIDKQKLPDVLYQIAEKCQNKPFKFHVWGVSMLDKDEITEKLKSLENVVYYGGYDGMSSIPTSNYDVFLYTSLYDGLPNVLLESFSFGMPPIASNVGGISELIDNNINGLLVEDIHNPDEYIKCLDKLQQNKELIKTLAQNGYNKIKQNHSWDGFISTIRDKY